MTAPADSLTRELIVPEQARAGADIPVTLRVTNTSDHLIELALLGREIAFDVVVTDSSGAEVYRRLAGKVVQSILQLKRLAPSESFQLSDTWKASSNLTGEFVIGAEVKTDAEPIRFRPVRVRISR